MPVLQRILKRLQRCIGDAEKLRRKCCDAAQIRLSRCLHVGGVETEGQCSSVVRLL